MPQSKRSAIIGAGAIGGNVAGPLHLHGFDVTLIDQWPEHVQAVRAHGLKVVRQNDQILAHVPILQRCAQIAQPRRVGIQLGAETIRVAKALGYRVEPVLKVDPDDRVAAAGGRNVNAVESAIAEAGNFSVGGRPSLLQDTMKGRGTEIDDLNGLLSRKGRGVGIATPLSDRIVKVMNALGVGFEPKPEHLEPLIELVP